MKKNVKIPDYISPGVVGRAMMLPNFRLTS